MPEQTQIIHSANVSEAWVNVFNLVMSSPGAQVGPIVLEVEAQSGIVIETPAIRKFIDAEIKKHPNIFSVETTSFLIFPWKLWNPYSSQKRAMSASDS